MNDCNFIATGPFRLIFHRDLVHGCSNRFLKKNFTRLHFWISGLHFPVRGLHFWSQNLPKRQKLCREHRAALEPATTHRDTLVQGLEELRKRFCRNVFLWIWHSGVHFGSIFGAIFTWSRKRYPALARRTPNDPRSFQTMPREPPPRFRTQRRM